MQLLSQIATTGTSLLVDACTEMQTVRMDGWISVQTCTTPCHACHTYASACMKFICSIDLPADAHAFIE
jgi:hypothetical protein